MPDPLSQAMAALREAAPGGFFVGGCVRDWLLGRPLKDLDAAVPEPVERAGREVARATGGVFFWLREAMRVGRVTLRGEPSLQVDLVPLTSSLDEDLRRRDFTVNAMAVSTRDGLLPGAPVIDPTGGRLDLERRWLRLAAPDALERDPLRCLRAFRLHTRLALTFAPGLEASIRRAGPALARISGERIRDELFVLLEGEQSAPIVADLLAHDLVSPWSAALAASAAGGPLPSRARPLPEGELPVAGARGSSAAISVAPSGVALLRGLDQWLATPAPPPAVLADLEASLNTRVTPPRSRRALARLAALSIGAGAAAAEIGRALCLSADERRLLTRAVGGAVALAAAHPSTGRDRLCFFQRWEPGAVEAALLALAAEPGREADKEEGRSSEAERWLLLADLLQRRLRPRPPLLTGEEIMAIRGLAPGPAVGRWLQQIEEERADHRLATAEQAREWLRTNPEARERQGEP